MDDGYFMKRALILARRAAGRTSPNPMVGAVIVRDRKIIAEGYHKKAGAPHAEVIAMKQAGGRARGSTLYVNLEPCCHIKKKTPPCTRAIIKAGIRRVVVAMTDPNPMVSGKGIQELRNAGIGVETGILEDEARRLNEAYIRFITVKRPFVILKLAQSLDGKIATSKGESKWITGEKARRLVHRLRNEMDAVMVGINTIIKDDPSLDCRLRGGRNPLRIILDSKLRIPCDARVLDHNDGRTIIVTTERANRDKMERIMDKGGQILIVNDRGGRVDIRDMMKRLGRMDIMSILIEGGSSIATSAISEGVVDKIMLFISPMIMGGTDSIPSIGGKSPPSLEDTVKVRELKVRKVGKDILLEGYLK